MDTTILEKIRPVTGTTINSSRILVLMITEFKMPRINIANVINLLNTTFNITNFAISFVNHHEVELHDAISDLIKNANK